MSSNVKVFGSIVNAESCVYDEDRGLILAVNRGAAQNQAPNDGYVSWSTTTDRCTPLSGSASPATVWC